jgi:hypothetical protein
MGNQFWIRTWLMISPAVQLWLPSLLDPVLVARQDDHKECWDLRGICALSFERLEPPRLVTWARFTLTYIRNAAQP